MPVREMGEMGGKEVRRSYGIKFSFRYMISEVLFDINIEMSGRPFNVGLEHWRMGIYIWKSSVYLW